MNTDLLQRLKDINPAPPNEAVPDEVWDAEQLLAALRWDTHEQAPPRGRQYRPWLIVTAASAVILLVVGGLAWLGRQQAADVIDRPATTVPQQSTTTTVQGQSATTTPPDRVSPLVSQGEGPTLTFVQGESPVVGNEFETTLDVDLGSGVWFRGALYALAGNDNLYRSSDGLIWELVSGWRGLQSGFISLQADGDRLMSIMSHDMEQDFIQVDTSTNGDDWVSSRIQLPLLRDSNMAGDSRVDDAGPAVFAVGPRGIVVASTVSLSFDAEGFANSLVDPDEDIHAEVVDLDLDNGLMTVRFLDENNDMEQIGDLREVDLEAAGFSDAFANLLAVLEADPDWEPQVPGFLAQVNDDGFPAQANAAVGYAWFSTNGANWQRIERSGPLDGGEFTAILATPDGFVATASNTYNANELPPNLRNLATGFDDGIVWESSDGITWTAATDLTNSDDGTLTSEYEPTSLLDLWDGEPVKLVLAARRDDETSVWTLTDPNQRIFPDIPSDGMKLQISQLGMIGTPTYGLEAPEGKIEILLSVDGTSWSRWEPPEFGQSGSAEAWIVGVGDDFVVVQVRGDESTASHSLWVGTLP